MSEKKKREIAGLVVALVAVLAGGVLFVGATAGWFDDAKAVLGAEYRCSSVEVSGENLEENSGEGSGESLEVCTGEFVDLTVEAYEKLIAEKKSFLIVVDQPSCTTAEKLKGYASEFALENGVKIYRMMFSGVKNSSLHEKVKYYPSFVVVSEGRVLNFLRADADEDAAAYNSSEDFSIWLDNNLALEE